MLEEAAQVKREVLNLQQSLKESLKTQNPWDREVEFQRKSLRRQYLRMLFVYPLAAESRDVENHLWIATSYQFISRYKERIAALDRSIYGSPRQQQQQNQQPSRPPGGQRVNEYRRLLPRFRQFLSEEEKFWVQLIVRIRRVFALDDAQRALTALSIVPDDGSTAPASDGATARRNQHQFPPEADAVSPVVSSMTPEQRQSQMAVLSKALVCLGDIERYKEQYNEAGGRPRAGHEDGPPAAVGHGRGGRGRRGAAAGAVAGIASAPMPRMRNYEKALQCYEQARALLPHDGNPSHQLAILAVYQKDTFGALVQYYRALCVRIPYDAAGDNMASTLSRALEAWKKKEKEKEGEIKDAKETSSPIPPRLRVESFKEKLIVLHAHFHFSSGESRKMAAIAQDVISDFRGLVSERVLPEDMIWKVVILAQGALWKHRSTRHTSKSSTANRRAPSAVSSVSAESAIATHLIAVHRVLLEVGAIEIAEEPQEDAGEHDLAQNITATFRRTLPALRLAGKWARSNIKYIAQAQSGLKGGAIGVNAYDASSSRNGDGMRDSRTRSAGLVSIEGVNEFWSAYARFSSALLRTFPLDELPTVSTPLDEDVELTGFLPTSVSSDSRRGVIGRGTGANGVVTTREQVHPNEEQLMRIKDLLNDARALAEAEETPISLIDNRFTFANGRSKGHQFTSTAADITVSHGRDSQHPSDSASVDLLSIIDHEASLRNGNADYEDDNMTETSRTDDDPVGDAFREALNGTDGDEDEQEDEIVWRPSVSPPISAQIAPAPLPMSYLNTSPVLPTFTPHRMIHQSPPAQQAGHDATPSATSKPLATTAEDLLKDLQRSGHTRVPSAPQSQLLFGSRGSGSLGSIWSTAHDGNAMNFQGSAAPSNSSFFSSQQSYDVPSQISYSSQRSLDHVLETPLPVMPIQQSPPFMSGGHHRVSSLSLGPPQGLPSPSPGLRYNYSGPYIQAAEPSSSPYSTGVPSSFADPVYSTPGHALRQQRPPGYSHQSIQHPRVPNASQSSLHTSLASLSAMQQLWSNPG